MTQTWSSGGSVHKRILSAIFSAFLVVLVARLLTSFVGTEHHPPVPVAQSTESTAPAISKSAGPTVVLAASRVPASPSPQAAAGLTDIDPHKAMGSKNAPIAIEVFSDFQCPACKALFMNVNQKLIDNY